LTSAPKTILVAQAPAQPTAPVTTRNANTIVITWAAPSDGYTAITSYTILIRQSDNVTFTESSACNGTLASVITALSCTVPISTLVAAPYSLSWGSSVYA
jgi:hypothetical protein